MFCNPIPGGISYEILEKALMQAKAGREHILAEMMKTLDHPRPELKPHVPRIEQMGPVCGLSRLRSLFSGQQ